MFKEEVSIEQKQREKALRYEYAMYVMLGSYFKSCKISSAFVEGRYKVNYAGLSGPKQEDMEEKVINVIETYILKTLKVKDIENKDVVMSCKPRENYVDGNTLIFKGEDFLFAFNIDPKYSHKKHTETLNITFLKNGVKKEKTE